MKRIPANIFISSHPVIPVIDVRSPLEYQKGHITGAVNIPIFNNEERHEIGIIYKSLGRDIAIKEGLGIVGPKMKLLAENAKKLSGLKSRKIYCWRGGMRSEKMAWLFELLGMECNVLDGGYKAYRNLQINDFENILSLNVLHGSTGCGKTEILKELKEFGEQVIDLEGLANHRGSAFGHINMTEQPTSQQFQNNVHNSLTHLNPQQPIWIEGESLRIGNVNLPDSLWDKMKSAKVIEIKINRGKRIKRLVKEYGTFPKTELIKSVTGLKKKISADKILSTINFIKTNQFAEAADILLDYYDRTYEFTRKRFRENSIITIDSETEDVSANAKMILEKFKDITHNEIQN